MAGFTSIGAVNVISRFSSRDGSIMATGADTDYLGMIHGRGRHWSPIGREFFMAGVTLTGAVDVAGIFTTGRHAIVTTDTVADKRCMVDNSNRRPGADIMA
jgi:hypothetical protein